MGKWKKRLADFMELPQTSFGECQFIEIESSNTVKICSCIEILAYDDGCSRFQTSEGVVTVTGRGLEICSYGNGVVILRGEISGVGFERSVRKC